MALLIGRTFSRLKTLLFLLLGILGTASVRAEASREHELEAVLLFNLARFADWPPDAFSSTNAPFIIGILGRDPFGKALDAAVAGESVQGHPLRVERLKGSPQASHCQILFISSSEQSRARMLVAALADRPVLTVSDIEGFCQQYGGMVSFYLNPHRKLRLRLNLNAARLAGVKFSSKLIQVAELESTCLPRTQPQRHSLPRLARHAPELARTAP